MPFLDDYADLIIWGGFALIIALIFAALVTRDTAHNQNPPPPPTTISAETTCGCCCCSQPTPLKPTGR